MNITSTPKAIHADEARAFCDAIRAIAANAEALENLESYLSYHFSGWIKNHANTPEGITDELNMFAGTDSIPF